MAPPTLAVNSRFSTTNCSNLATKKTFWKLARSFYFGQWPRTHPSAAATTITTSMTTATTREMPAMTTMTSVRKNGRCLSWPWRAARYTKTKFISKVIIVIHPLPPIRLLLYCHLAFAWYWNIRVVAKIWASLLAETACKVSLLPQFSWKSRGIILCSIF